MKSYISYAALQNVAANAREESASLGKAVSYCFIAMILVIGMTGMVRDIIYTFLWYAGSTYIVFAAEEWEGVTAFYERALHMTTAQVCSH